MQVAYEITTRVGVGQQLTTCVPIISGAVVWQTDPNDIDEIGVKRLTQPEIMALPQPEQDTFKRYCWQVTPLHWEGMTEHIERDPMNYLNHSCDPNLWFVNDFSLVARSDIHTGEALTIDYATCDTLYAEIPKCLCGCPECRQIITQDDAYNPLIRSRYSGHFRSCLNDFPDFR
jgi:hypothetical protein